MEGLTVVKPVINPLYKVFARTNVFMTPSPTNVFQAREETRPKHEEVCPKHDGVYQLMVEPIVEPFTV